MATRYRLNAAGKVWKDFNLRGANLELCTMRKL